MIENNFEHLWHKQTRLFLFKRGPLESLIIIYLINITSASIFKNVTITSHTVTRNCKFLLRNMPTYRCIVHL